MAKRDYDHLFKLVLIGDTGVGKSCLLLRCEDQGAGRARDDDDDDDDDRARVHTSAAARAAPRRH